MAGGSWCPSTPYVKGGGYNAGYYMGYLNPHPSSVYISESDSCSVSSDSLKPHGL